jgi:thiol-disulfide isomerase/thioredoxin
MTAMYDQVKSRHISRLPLALITGLAIFGFACSGYCGELPSRIAAPNFPARGWVNSPPLTLAQLRGRVVLVDFWEYTCINCIRTFPYLRRWNELYTPVGLTIIAVHTPEFAFAKNPANVTNAVKRFGFSFPVVMDNDQAIWSAYNNDAWPADYLIDQNGHIAYISARAIMARPNLRFASF